MTDYVFYKMSGVRTNVPEGSSMGAALHEHDLVITGDGKVLKDRQGYLSKKASGQKNEPRFQVGDKVQPAVGTVTAVNFSDGMIAVSYDRYQTYDCYFNQYDLDLVERPKKEPKLGSVWQHRRTGETWVYIGSGRFHRANGSGIYTDRHYLDENWVEVL